MYEVVLLMLIVFYPNPPGPGARAAIRTKDREEVLDRRRVVKGNTDSNEWCRV